MKTQAAGRCAADTRGGHNPRTIGVALLGDYTAREPSDAALTALVEVLAWKCARWNLDPQGESAYVLASGDTQTLPTIVPHGQIRATECPGPHLDRLVPDLRTRTAVALAAAPASEAPAATDRS